MPKIMTVGDVVVEFLGGRKNQRFSKTGIFEGPFPAGSASIFIDQAARLGASAGIIAKVGNDGFAELALSRLREDGVDLRGICRSKTTNTGAVFVTYDSDGSRRYLFHYANSAMGELAEEDVGEEFFEGCETLFFSGSNAMATDSMYAAVRRALEIARDKKIKVAFDPNVRPELHSREVLDKCVPILRQCTYFLGNEPELLALAGKEDLKQALRTPELKNIPVIVLKMGSRGVRVITKEGQFHLPAFPVREVDPTGAGDSWDGAFLTRLCFGDTLPQAAEYANAAAALSVTRKGPVSGFMRAEVETFLHECGPREITHS